MTSTVGAPRVLCPAHEGCVPFVACTTVTRRQDLSSEELLVCLSYLATRHSSPATALKTKKPQPEGWGAVRYKNKSTTLVPLLSIKILKISKCFKSRRITKE